MSDRPLPASGEPLGHYVNPAPFDAREIETLTPAQEKIYLASQWQLMWWKFTRHRVAVASAIFLVFMYFCAAFAEFLSPYNYQTRHIDHIYAPPQAVRLFHDGRFVGPHVLGYDYRLNMDTLKREYTPNPAKVQPLRFFCRGDGYLFWGLIEATGTCSVQPTAATLSCSAPTGSAVTSSLGFSTARASRSPSG